MRYLSTIVFCAAAALINAMGCSDERSADRAGRGAEDAVDEPEREDESPRNELEREMEQARGLQARMGSASRMACAASPTIQLATAKNSIASSQ